MATYAERVEEIAARLRTLGRAGQVHTRRRFSGDWGKYLNHFSNPGDGGRIYGWTISRRSGKGGESAARWVDAYQLTRVAGLKDADETEILFQQDLDDAVALFRDQPQFSFGEVVDAQAEIENVYDSEVGSPLCHVGVLVLPVSFYFHEIGGGE